MKRPKLDRDTARALLKERELPSVLGMPPRHTTPFAEQQCEHCGGVHARNCPAVAEIEYYESGKVKRVAFWQRDMWSDEGVLWLDDVIAAAGDDD